MSKTKLICVKCDRSTWSVSRDRRVIEFRTISNKHSSGKVSYEFNSGWRKEKDSQTKKQFLRCQSCSYELELKDYPSIEEVKFDTNGVIIVSKHKFF